jgi:DNA-binding NarL/FixJ family response regulator
MPTTALPAFPIRLAIVEDDARVRELLREYLCYQPEFTCPIVVDSIEALWQELDLSLAPRVILLDVSLPGQTGLQALPELKKRLPGTDIILQTMHDDPERIFQALRAGATGYVIKNATSLPQYKQAILDVLNGGAALSPSVARKALQHFQPQPSQQPGLLSAREQEVLQALTEGLSEKQVAARLILSPDTVHTYVKRLYEKLRVNSRSELLSRAAKGDL